MTSPPRSIIDLPDELLLEITRDAVKVRSEHELVAPDGHYYPSQFEERSLNLNQKIRKSRHDSLAVDYAFVEVYYHGCQAHGTDRNAIRHFNNIFQNAHFDRLLRLRNNGRVQLSTFRIDIRCPTSCTHAAGPVQLLVSTEATLFANMLICNMIQCLLPYDRRIEVHLACHSESMRPMLDKTRVCMSRYLRNTTVIRTTGLGFGLNQPLTNIIATNIDTMTAGDFANLLKNHMRDIQNMLFTGTSVVDLVPVAFWFNKAFARALLVLGDADDQIEAHLWRYVNYLQENNTDIILRGTANFLLSNPANSPHWIMSDGTYYLRFAAQLRGRKPILKTRDEQYLDYRSEAEGSSDPIEMLAEVSKRFKIEELHKTYALINLAVARLLAVPLSVLPQWARNYVQMSIGYRSSSGADCLEGMVSVENYVLSDLDEKVSDNPFPTTPGDLTQEEFQTYYRTKMWLQHLDILVAAVRRCFAYNSDQVRLSGQQALHHPFLHNSTMWGPIPNLVPGELDRQFKRISFDCFPDSMKQRFDDLLREVMTEYTMPYFGDLETLNAVHEELEAVGLV